MAGNAWLVASALGLPLALAWGCNSVTAGNDAECGSPPPSQAESECPPTWQCIDGDWVDTAGACLPDECPQLEPAENDACGASGQQCSYWHEDEPCGEEHGYRDYQCTDGRWTLVRTRCTQSQDCPSELPVAGSDCSASPYATCVFQVQGECGPTTALAQCVDEGAGLIWQVVAAESCDCSAQIDADACGVAGCRWLVPGCGESPLGQAGCYPPEDCTADSCGEGQVCTEVSVDPCWNQGCGACGAQAAVCDVLVGGDGGA